MDKFAHKAAAFTLAYPFLVIGAAALILLTVNLLLRFGEPVIGEVDGGDVIVLASLALIFTLAGIDARRLWEDRTNG